VLAARSFSITWGTHDFVVRDYDLQMHSTTPFKSRTIALVGIVLVGIALAPLTSRSAVAAPQDPVADAVAALTPLVNLGVPIDVVFDPPLVGITDLAYPSVRGRSTLPQIDANETLAYAWITGKATGQLGVVTDVVYPPAKNAWECAHSLINYGLWIRATRHDPWSPWGSGSFHGFWKEGLGCYMNPGPENLFKDGSTVTEFGHPDGGLVFEYLVGVKKWAHNDPSFGLSGRCREVHCYYRGTIRIGTKKN
jgi:hypothetical protein